MKRFKSTLGIILAIVMVSMTIFPAIFLFLHIL